MLHDSSQNRCKIFTLFITYFLLVGQQGGVISERRPSNGVFKHKMGTVQFYFSVQDYSLCNIFHEVIFIPYNTCVLSDL